MYRPLLGGFLIILIYFLFHGDRYLGLGEEVIEKSFIDSVLPYDFLGKIVSTSLSAGFGFKGGEVMPLFYIGSTFANFIAKLSHFPLEFVVPLGFIGVFAGAVNVPITGVVLAYEFFGAEILPFAIIVCLLSYFFSGKTGIYHSQKSRFKKF
jgi:H+/Cl- antiporter ClcA